MRASHLAHSLSMGWFKLYHTSSESASQSQRSLRNADRFSENFMAAYGLADKKEPLPWSVGGKEKRKCRHSLAGFKSKPPLLLSAPFTSFFRGQTTFLPAFYLHNERHLLTSVEHRPCQKND